MINSAVKIYLADRFHVIRLLQHQCMQVYRAISKEVKYNRGVLPLLRTREDRLSPKKRMQLQQFLICNPVIDSIYQFQKKLYQLLMKKRCSKQVCYHLISQFLEMISLLKKSPFKPCQRLEKHCTHGVKRLCVCGGLVRTMGSPKGFIAK